MDSNAPKEFSVSTELQFSMRKLFLDFFYSEKTVYFFFGMATEGFGMAVQPMLGLPTYPSGDFLVGVVIAMILMWWQKSHPRVECVEDDEEEQEDDTETEDETPAAD